MPCRAVMGVLAGAHPQAPPGTLRRSPSGSHVGQCQLLPPRGTNPGHGGLQHRCEPGWEEGVLANSHPPNTGYWGGELPSLASRPFPHGGVGIPGQGVSGRLGLSWDPRRASALQLQALPRSRGAAGAGAGAGPSTSPCSRRACCPGDVAESRLSPWGPAASAEQPGSLPSSGDHRSWGAGKDPGSCFTTRLCWIRPSACSHPGRAHCCRCVG